ncbi:hypothetical protein D9619_001410 [Psilocybe cf. subviscida]|uniref:C2H2-type domain-containing protein n=1 Tax=Psilocybe cf. subviscida TaxID=2480587 RepID=A0A8H5BFR4_9AGAR|nr:hypothetical protein D9619_001410 [Psilocybe cf. subviscida]
MADHTPNSQLFTCLSCAIAFLSAEEQRNHYRSDHHRYNMKRRVASLPPISVAVFNQKVLERRTETAIMSSTKGSACEVCNKTYTTENAYRSHIQSKKHKENELKAASRPPPSAPTSDTVESAPEASQTAAAPSTEPPEGDQANTESKASNSLVVDEDADEDEVMKTIDEKIAAARARLSTNNCLFCTSTFSSLEENLTHMSVGHSFFIPDAEYLVDLPGLIAYLGEKIAVGNVCIYCNEKGREFRSLDAVRKHMVDKAHCKIAYEKERERMEVSDFYDFSASYPDAEVVAQKKVSKKSKVEDGSDTDKDSEEEEEWEEASDVDDEDVDEIVDESDSDVTDSDDEDIPQNEMSYGDSPFELVLPSGARIGHRTMKRYYAQSFPSTPRYNKPEDPNSGAALVRRLIADKNSALVPTRGGFGAFGKGTEVVKARNRGEAREAGRHVREFRDMKRREDFKTKVGFIGNSQKHYRDPLLQ